MPKPKHSFARQPGTRPRIHPGEILEEEWLKPLALSSAEAARRLGLSQQLVNQIVRGKGPVTARTALRLERLFGPSAEFWLRLQQNWDLWHELRASKGDLARIRRLKWEGR